MKRSLLITSSVIAVIIAIGSATYFLTNRPATPTPAPAETVESTPKNVTAELIAKNVKPGAALDSTDPKSELLPATGDLYLKLSGDIENETLLVPNLYAIDHCNLETDRASLAPLALDVMIGVNTAEYRCWYAGFGDTITITRTPDELIAYRTKVDEQAPPQSAEAARLPISATTILTFTDKAEQSRTNSATSQNIGDRATYTNATSAYTFTYPKSWFIDNTLPDNTIIVREAKGEHWLYQIETKDAPPNSTLEDLAKKLNGTVNEIKLGGKSAKYAVATSASDYGNTTVIILVNKKLITIHGDSNTEDFPKFLQSMTFPSK